MLTAHIEVRNKPQQPEQICTVSYAILNTAESVFQVSFYSERIHKITNAILSTVPYEMRVIIAGPQLFTYAEMGNKRKTEFRCDKMRYLRPRFKSGTSYSDCSGLESTERT